MEDSVPDVVASVDLEVAPARSDIQVNEAAAPPGENVAGRLVQFNVGLHLRSCPDSQPDAEVACLHLLCLELLHQLLVRVCHNDFLRLLECQQVGCGGRGASPERDVEGTGLGRGRIGAEQEGTERAGNVHRSGRGDVPVECGIVLLPGVKSEYIIEVQVNAELHILEVPPFYTTAHIAFSPVPVADSHAVEHYSVRAEIHRSGGGIFNPGEVDPHFRIVDSQIFSAEFGFRDEASYVELPGCCSGDAGEYRAQERGEIPCVQAVCHYPSAYLPGAGIQVAYCVERPDPVNVVPAYHIEFLRFLLPYAGDSQLADGPACELGGVAEKVEKYAGPFG